jgi:hypothetical protein
MKPSRRAGPVLSLTLLALALGLAACRSETPSELITLCHDPRSPVCTREYRPVCGERRDGSRHTYANACEACASSQVVGHRPGACESDPEEAS